MTVNFADLSEGDTLPPLEFGPVSRHVLALYCGGSGDHNPIHVDIDFARASGVDDVFAHGMFSMGVLARMLTQWVPQEQIREFGVRFTALTPVHATITCKGKVVEKLTIDGEQCVRLKLATALDDGTVTLAGSATVALS